MKILTAALITAGLALAAFSQSACTKNEQTDKKAEAGKKNEGARKSGEPITRAQAEQKMLKKFPEGYLISSESELQEGKLFYDIEIKVAGVVHQATIDAMNGKVIETDDNTLKFRADSLNGKAPLWPVNLAERDAAEQTALQAYPGEVQQWKAVADSGRAAFSFRIKSASGESKKVVVKAGSNEVLKIKY